MARVSDLVARWRRAYEEPFSGWDFRGMGVSDDPLPWSYGDKARVHLMRAASALDIGTGGGERLADLSDAWPRLVVATEDWEPNVGVAAGRLGPRGAFVVRSGTSASDELPFRPACFDVVLARHAGAKLVEIVRVLRPGGVLVTQQIGAGNLDELRERFGLPRPVTPDFVDLSPVAAQEAGLEVVEDQQWRGRMHVRGVEALVSYIRAIPWELPGFDFDTHVAVLNGIHADAARQPISFGIARTLLVARRSPQE